MVSGSLYSIHNKINKCVIHLLVLHVNNLFFFSLPKSPVLQVSGIRSAIYFWPAGYATVEETNVQRTVWLQAHSVTHTPIPACHLHLFPHLTLTEGQWYINRRTAGASNGLEKKFFKNLFVCQYPEKHCISFSTICRIFSFSVFTSLRAPVENSIIISMSWLFLSGWQEAKMTFQFVMCKCFTLL